MQHLRPYLRLSFTLHQYLAGSPRIRTPGILPPLVRMDYIWHSDGLQTTRAWQGKFVGSDHLPLLAEFAIVP